MSKTRATSPAKEVKKFEKIGRINSNYQVTIPAEMRKIMKIEAGGYIRTIFVSGKLVIEPVKVVSPSQIKKSVLKDQDEEDRAWAQLNQEQFLKGYSEEDTAYDNL
ncbi:MAG: hypothetical protein A3F54_03580 [Candidatus Kerfeldbacteria bacterium RIFCSPHIGHO2_12_FULL_48_17]|uniref:SpoVT-AbrB domain-containing protein n=1 Tax=Candidatus Kerfeldbacteria bacterium RIFCSPHIGHO2_12_FULL_48_17 TaxID=1798542 RepID=A0A1G2AYK0_9BACT|nr:MAG: hypothetical protein A3F54_03580 [Candidatus Kerfeldbacteria bacterium RIFCSPHIGHO2_12_FULL_48_17]